MYIYMYNIRVHVYTSCIMSQVEDVTRRRQLEAVDMFLETARSHLKTLTISTDSATGDSEPLPSLTGSDATN